LEEIMIEKSYNNLFVVFLKFKFILRLCKGTLKCLTKDSLHLNAVMLMGTLVYGIRYSFPEYVCTFLVAGGVSTFALLKVRNFSE